jgi:hypothetical protein
MANRLKSLKVTFDRCIKFFCEQKAVLNVSWCCDVVLEFQSAWSWTKLALRFPTRGDEEHEGQAVYGRADHLRAAPG